MGAIRSKTHYWGTTRNMLDKGSKRNIASDIVVAFKDILKTKSYDKISVSEICQRAGVSRNAFYVHFEDKDDIVRFLFKLHFTKPISDLIAILDSQDVNKIVPMIYERSYQGIYAEKEYYTNLIRPIYGKNDVFIRVVTNVLTELNIKTHQRRGTLGKPWEIEYISYFLSASQAMLLLRWIYNGMDIPPTKLAKFYNAVTRDMWKHKNELFR